ncbi:MAG: toll/interleukin-1 receptor domain-containing protein, partial [Clostridia bacterium]|nr:toll/interleukin-1 receptor domain-containing protein [Clostridia bacterium]
MNNIRGNDYEPYIYHALTTAKVLIVICSDRKNLESKWVHNEWWRFWRFAKGTEKTIIPVCRRHFDPSQLPDELRNC